ncbi:Zn-dependent exopeptidase M28 [Sulfidibacter corallicola]|uniref:Zn-dependent exopeptidase M28 n=1 Tax=Sulfidibacter corallicola TaxID=2818388 RepID=A0A8A4TK43_SULCO|nr:Zn-dependent exopeptidase M28 [Sulfidibacter corallicola]QTD50306.1 Zn-dependent exopeptidase M28 [Sulfidibacter corallicola]
MSPMVFGLKLLTRTVSRRHFVLWSALTLIAMPVWAADSHYARVDIHRIGPARLAQLKQTKDLAWWVEMDATLVVLADADILADLGRTHRVEVLYDVPVDPSSLYFLRMDHFRELDRIDGWVLARGGRYALLQMRSAPPKYHSHGAHTHRLVFEGFRANEILAAQMENHRIPRKRGADPAIQALVDGVDKQRWHNDVDTLAGFNRYSYGSEIAQARDWLVSEFQKIAGLQVSIEEFQLGDSTLHNVVARIEGTTRPNDWYIIGGHYDSTSQSPSSAAPGAEDNGSGSAGVLEMARILVPARPQGTVIFICFSGEEQGLWGSRDHVERLQADGHASKIKAMLNMDMIGYTGDADLDVLLETSSSVSWMVDIFAAAATDYTTLRSVTSFNPFGSDHMPYLNAGLPALLTIENDWDSYPGYHRTNDLIDNVDLDMGGETLKMNVAAMAEIIGIAVETPPQWGAYVAHWNQLAGGDVPDQVEDGIIDVLDLVSLINGGAFNP